MQGTPAGVHGPSIRVPVAVLAVLFAVALIAPQGNGHPVSVLMRAGHLLAVAVFLGGTALMCLLKGEARDRVAPSWRSLCHLLMLIIIGTGLYFAVRDWPQFRGDKLF